MTTLKEYKAMMEGATDAPWYVITTEDKGSGKIISITTSLNPQAGDSRVVICRILNIVSDRPLDIEDKSNAEFIAASRNIAPELIRVIELVEDILKRCSAHTSRTEKVLKAGCENALSEIRKLKGE